MQCQPASQSPLSEQSRSLSPEQAATANAKMASTIVSLVGGGQPVSLVQPYLALQYIIATDVGLASGTP